MRTYARVSTDSQEIRTQSDRLALAAPGARPFADDGVSGKGVERPSFDSLLGEIRAGHVGSVYVTKLDRLGRSARGILEFFDQAEDNGVRVVVLDQQIDTATPVGRLVRTVLSGMAELEADLISSRTRDAMAAFKAGTRRTKSGRPVGRPRKITPEHEAQISRLRGEGFRWADIAMKVHLPTGSCRKVGSRLHLPPPARASHEITTRIVEQIIGLRAAGLTWRAVASTVRFPAPACKAAVAAYRLSTNSAINSAADLEHRGASEGTRATK